MQHWARRCLRDRAGSVNFRDNPRSFTSTEQVGLDRVIKRWGRCDLTPARHWASARGVWRGSLCEAALRARNKGRAKSWTFRSVADAKRSETRSSPVESCYKHPPAWLTTICIWYRCRTSSSEIRVGSSPVPLFYFIKSWRRTRMTKSVPPITAQAPKKMNRMRSRGDRRASSCPARSAQRFERIWRVSWGRIPRWIWRVLRGWVIPCRTCPLPTALSNAVLSGADESYVGM